MKTVVDVGKKVMAMDHYTTIVGNVKLRSFTLLTFDQRGLFSSHYGHLSSTIFIV